jgi:capsular polysaccharide biosynthesis protein
VSFSTYWTSVRRNAVLIAVIVVVATAGAFVLSRARGDVFDASSTVIIGPAIGLPADQSVNIIDSASRSTLPTSLQEVMQSDQVVATALVATKLPLKGYTVTASAVPNSMVVLVSVSGPSADGVKRLADAVSAEGSKQFSVYFPQVGVSTVALAVVPAARTSPKPTRDAALAAIAALIVGMLVALARESVRRDRAAVVAPPASNGG